MSAPAPPFPTPKAGDPVEIARALLDGARLWSMGAHRAALQELRVAASGFSAGDSANLTEDAPPSSLPASSLRAVEIAMAMMQLSRWLEEDSFDAPPSISIEIESEPVSSIELESNELELGSGEFTQLSSGELEQPEFEGYARPSTKIRASISAEPTQIREVKGGRFPRPPQIQITGMSPALPLGKLAGTKPTTATAKSPSPAFPPKHPTDSPKPSPSRAPPKTVPSGELPIVKPAPSPLAPSRQIAGLESRAQSPTFESERPPATLRGEVARIYKPKETLELDVTELGLDEDDWDLAGSPVPSTAPITRRLSPFEEYPPQEAFIPEDSPETRRISPESFYPPSGAASLRATMPAPAPRNVDDRTTQIPELIAPKPTDPKAR